MKILRYFNPNKIQPQYAQTELCAAVFMAQTLSAHWIPIPCEETIPDATFVCESKMNSNQININIFRAAIECPRKTINYKSSCLYIINYMNKHNYTADKICYLQGMSVFRFPNFVIQSDPKVGWVSWNQENFFFLKFLISMVRRWPSIYDRNSDNIDVIVAGGRPSPDKLHTFGIQYSEANLVHIRILNMHNNSLPGSLYILCDNPMLISNGLCLHGHSLCNDGTCILSHYVCDGRADCPDGSDEMDCSHVCSFSDDYSGNLNCFFSCISPECLCNDLYFSCALGGCVPWSRVCDGVFDCPHGEDEEQCHFSDVNAVTRALFIVNNFHENDPLKFSVDEYQCKNGPNISHTLVNDLVPDCPEQDDEETYHAFLKNGSRADFFTERVLCKHSDATTCAKNYRGVCYPRHLHCIYETVNVPKSTVSSVQQPETCRNGAHLNNCELYTCPSFFKCPSAYCIPVYTVCNGRIDCPNGEDENNCQKNALSGVSVM